MFGKLIVNCLLFPLFSVLFLGVHSSLTSITGLICSSTLAVLLVISTNCFKSKKVQIVLVLAAGAFLIMLYLQALGADIGQAYGDAVYWAISGKVLAPTFFHRIGMLLPVLFSRDLFLNILAPAFWIVAVLGVTPLLVTLVISWEKQKSARNKIISIFLANFLFSAPCYAFNSYAGCDDLNMMLIPVAFLFPVMLTTLTGMFLPRFLFFPV